MPRNYVPKPGAKRYKKYDDFLIQQALDEITSTNNCLSVVAEKYGIAKSVLCRHKNREMKPHGRPTALTKEEELYVVENLNICGDWGYPLDTTDLRYIIKNYLDSMNIQHKIFKNNMPGIDYVNGFLKRHANKISQRICQNIKRSRAAVSPDMIKRYFDELAKSLENVPIGNIINYDETNLTDDPGRKKVIVRRGCKYPERVVNHSKGSISLMMSATADGYFLPPYVVYKATHLYDSWTTRGPQNARYNRSLSGWFDGNIFEDWVKTIVIPFLEKKDGKKVLIGDNLSSHLSIDVIKLCQENNIHFIFLPANSTHLGDDGRTQSCVPKGCFPLLLKMLLDELSVNSEKNIRAGFRKCGIVPIDPSQVLARLPLRENNEDEEAKILAVNESFLKLLKEMRYGSINVREPKKKVKLEVVAGKSVSAEEIDRNEDQEPVKPKKKKTIKQTKELTPKVMSLKGKGIGKKTKPKIDTKNDNKDVNSNHCLKICSQSLEIHDYSEYNMVIPDPFDVTIDEMPIVFSENFDCEEIIVRSDNENQNNQDDTKENVNLQIQKPKIEILSDIKLPIPLTSKNKYVNLTSQNSITSNSTLPKRKRILNFTKDREEILKILEEN